MLSLGQPARQDPPELPGPRVLRGLARRELPVRQDPPALRVQRVMLGPREQRARLDPLVPLVLPVKMAATVRTELKVR